MAPASSRPCAEWRRGSLGGLAKLLAVIAFGRGGLADEPEERDARGAGGGSGGLPPSPALGAAKLFPAPRQQLDELVLEVAAGPSHLIVLQVRQPPVASREPAAHAVQRHDPLQLRRQPRLLAPMALRLEPLALLDGGLRVAALGFVANSLPHAQQQLVGAVQFLKVSLRGVPLLGRVLIRVRAQRAGYATLTARSPSPPWAARRAWG